MKGIKKIGIILGLLLMMTVVSATLLTHYGTSNSTAQVNQSIEVVGSECSGNDCYHDFGSVVAGNTYTYCDVTVKNNANSPIPVRFDTVITDSLGGDASDAVTVRYLSTVVLKSKYQQNWTEMNDGREAEVTFEIVANNFNYDMKTKGLVANTDYSLIYYADPWSGNHPGKLVGTFKTDGTGVYSATGLHTSLGMNMPNIADANYNPTPNFCNGNNGYDDYDLCGSGAKFWIVPNTDYTEPSVTAWNPDNYLFETDLITYSDKQDNGNKLFVGTGEFEMCVEVTFDPATPADTYTMNMTVSVV